MMKKICVVLLVLALLATLLVPILSHAASEDELTILFTHDLHDNLENFNVEIDGKIHSRGGFARLYSAIIEERQLDQDLLLVDAGDFSMGTLFQTIFATEAPALRLMGKMGFDATTLGNHEYDFRTEGLAKSLISAKNSGDPLPEIVVSNTDIPKDNDRELLDLKAAFAEYGVKDYTVIEKKGFKIGLFGLMGYEADSNAPMAKVAFRDMIEESKRVVKTLKEDEKVDLIIALSHSGTDGEPGKTEDEVLAKEVPEIDLVISGHSHTVLDQPIQIDDSFVVSAGYYGENLGKVVLQKNIDVWDLKDYQLIPIDDSFAVDPAISAIIEDYKDIIDEEYLSLYDLHYDQVVTQSPFNFTPAAKLGAVQEEEPLGNLICDAYVYAVKEAEGEAYEKVDVAIVPVGVIRDSIVAGDLTVKDVFKISPLGIGEDKISGYPLLDVYLTGKELKTAAEVDASVQPLMLAAQLYMSGLQYSFNPNRMIFNKVTDISLFDDISTSELDEDKLYRVVTNLYSAQMLGAVTDLSKGILSLVPKDENGVALENFEDRIIYDGDKEVKEWVALTSYLQSFDKKDGIAQIDEKYAGPLNRKIVNTESDLVSRFEKPNIIALVIYLIIIVVLVIVILLIRFIVRKIRNRKRKKINKE
jgi:2',3'-cyclic-nucleotide 2'-phosphodiesterase (5'-nucleotidase family)